MELKREPWRRPNSAGLWLCQWPALHRPGPWPGPGPAVFLSRAAAAASEKPHQDFPVRATPSSSSGRGSGGVSPKGFQFLSKKLEGPNPTVQSQVLGQGGPTSGAFPPRVHGRTFQKRKAGPGFAGPFPCPPPSLPSGHTPLRPSLPPPTRGACAQNVACPPSGTRQVEIYFLSPPSQRPGSPVSSGLCWATQHLTQTKAQQVTPASCQCRVTEDLQTSLRTHWEPQELKARLFFLRRPGLVAKQKS